MDRLLLIQDLVISGVFLCRHRARFRFLLLRSAASFTRRSFCTGGALQQGKQGRAPDMIEGNPQFHVSNVRNRLREIVGASTNWSFDLLTVLSRFRFGRILEDLDSLAVLISYSHTYNSELKRSPLSIVTALVDKIDMRQHVIYPDCDIKFTGHVTWVGKSSIEAKIHMSQYRDGAYASVLDATFVMVARDPGNKRAAFVNPLTPEGPEEERLLQEGEANKSRRVELSTASLLKVAPTQDERTVVHGLFLNTLDTNTVSFRSRILPPNSVWMEDAKLKGLEICHPQERNIFNRIFGGFLMRKAYELGWANACSYGGCRPSLVAVDDILFQKPVEIGSLLMLSSQVCYTQGTYIQVRVHSEVFDPLTRQHNTTNIFHFTFTSDRDVPNIMPKTYGESMLYLDGKRHFDQTVAC
ncbi:acyl-CoA thioesterase 9, tandem duplicate 1 [Neolamprologus brichardi]|uniref:acyl-CoA thioesterase 9, tandem duplicate 1 n=1 Tax=Neolamprologus brichardi TaxID=32507 RepID=UPI0003EC2F66|nr:acyl-CoA thioesterase 9, tandem duplicate 1 [Neolamprologus brichardi]